MSPPSQMVRNREESAAGGQAGMALVAGPPPHPRSPGPLESGSPWPSSPQWMGSDAPFLCPLLPQGPRVGDGRRGAQEGVCYLQLRHCWEKRHPLPAFHRLPAPQPGSRDVPPLCSAPVGPGAARARGPWLPPPAGQPQSPVPKVWGGGGGGSPGPTLSPGSDRERAAWSPGAGRGGRPRGR